MSTDITTSAGQMVINKVSGAPCSCGCDDACGLERVRFFPRQILGADDLMTEQRYFKEKLRRHNRYLHGWGVVCGCQVQPAPTANKPYQVLICPGYVITPQGDEIMIGCPALFDLATCMVSSDDPCAFARPCPPVTAYTPLRQKIVLTVCYKECEVRPVRVAPGGCSCDDAQCDYSRIRDAYEFACLDGLPATHGPIAFGGQGTCPPCPQDNCVVLATIRLETTYKPILPPNVSPATLAVDYMVAVNAPVQIDNLTDRHTLYSSAMLQPVAATPLITLVGTFTVQITDATPSASIYYTIDGTDPSTSSTLYGGEFGAAGGPQYIVKAIAVASGYQNSSIASTVVVP